MPQLPFSFGDKPEDQQRAEAEQRGRESAREIAKERAEAQRRAKESARETEREAAKEREREAAKEREREAQRAREREAAAIKERAAAKPAVYTVTELQARLRGELEQRYAVVLVSGEISNYNLNARSGHAYFTLKDDGAQLKCVLFRDNLIRIRHRLADGLQVIVRGRVTVYEQGGQLQLLVQVVEPRGLGARQQEYQDRVEKLRKEGLTADARKRKLPAFPETIGVVTSRSGAAIRDVLRTILRRDPFAHVIIANTAVQGDGATFGIVQALRALDRLGRCEVILLCRGGGSVEDLWCFNEEPVARAIAACSVPVVTGIGHETDTTIADLVADLRASTPTAAAEHAVPVRSEVRARFEKLEGALHRALALKSQSLSRRLLELSARLEHPRARLERRAQHIDELETRAERAARKHFARAAERLLRAERRLARQDPASRLRATAHRLELADARMARAIARKLDRERHALAIAAGRLESLSPLAILARGYALVQTEDGRVVKRAREVREGDRLAVRLGEGALSVRVEARDPPGGDENA